MRDRLLVIVGKVLPNITAMAKILKRESAAMDWGDEGNPVIECSQPSDRQEPSKPLGDRIDHVLKVLKGFDQSPTLLAYLNLNR
jgi:hypothetical protein